MHFSGSESCKLWWLGERQWLSWQGCHWDCCLVVPKAGCSAQRAVRCQGEELLYCEQAVHIREDGQVFPEALQSQEPELHVERKERKIEISFESQGWKLSR